MKNIKILIIAFASFIAPLLSQGINPLEYYPLTEGKIWKFDGKFRNNRGLEKKYHFTIEVQGAEPVKGGTSYTLFRTSYGDGPNDEPEQIDYINNNIIDMSIDLIILKEYMKEGDSWQSVSRNGSVQGKITVLKFNYSEIIAKKIFNNCIKVFIENNVYKFYEEIVFSKHVGPIKRERFQSLRDYKNHKPSGIDLIRISK
jgi:hypothetical protein